MQRARKLDLRMTLDEFLAWGGGGDARYELIDGSVFLMAPASEPHGTLVMNLGRLLGNALAGRRPCRVVAEAAIARSAARHRCFQADVAVTCAPPARGRILVDQPLLIAEVLSPSTEATDRRIKVPDYRAIGSVEEILLIDQDRPFVELLRRLDGERWLTVLAVGLEATLTLESVGVDLRLEELYRDVELLPSADPDTSLTAEGAV